MTVIRITTIVYLALGAAACDRARSPDGSQSNARAQPPAAGEGSHTTDTTLAVSGRDTILLETRQDTTRIVWRTSIGGQVVRRWESGPTYSGMPVISLQDLNGDGIPDLFWTLQHEEIVAGMVLLGTANGARPVFVTDERTCRVPELRDVNGDGRPDVVNYESGALTHDECRGDALAEPCQRTYPTEWAVAWIQEADSFVNVPPRAKSFYSDRATAYEAAARQIRSRLASGGKPAPSPRCDLHLAAAIDSMAARAHALGPAR